jgi:hypothetical protein
VQWVHGSEPAQSLLVPSKTDFGETGAVMTADSDDLERELQENLRLREELGAKAAEGEAALRRSQFADPNWQAFIFAMLLLLIFITLVLIITQT